MKLNESEADFQRWVTDLAAIQRWWVFHDQDSTRNEPGWPDLVLLDKNCIGRRPLFLELKKSARAKPTKEQQMVLRMLDAGQAGHVIIARPTDRPLLEAALMVPQNTKAVDASSAAISKLVTATRAELDFLAAKRNARASDSGRDRNFV